MGNDVEKGYAAFYAGRQNAHIYPVEFVVRAFLGTYPRLKPQPDAYRGAHVLDLGFGDGRNAPLLHNLGMKLHGVEISEEICAFAVARLKPLGIDMDARVGRNCALPFDDASFDVIVACHACYYVDEGTTFAENVSEMARVLKPGGRLVFSAPMRSSYIVRDAEDLGHGHMRVVSDPYGIRNGTILRAFADEEEILNAFDQSFADFAIGKCHNDFWGIEEHVWTASCFRARANGTESES
jgi:SAM-dependent methyltransferase